MKDNRIMARMQKMAAGEELHQFDGLYEQYLNVFNDIVDVKGDVNTNYVKGQSPTYYDRNGDGDPGWPEESDMSGVLTYTMKRSDFEAKFGNKLTDEEWNGLCRIVKREVDRVQAANIKRTLSDLEDDLAIHLYDDAREFADTAPSELTEVRTLNIQDTISGDLISLAFDFLFDVKFNDSDW